VSEFVESAGGILVVLLLAVLVLWILYIVFGPQALGVPALIGVLVVIGVGSVVPTLGLFTVVAMIGGLLVLFIVVGMAMSLGPEKLPKAHDERPKED
jgi:hypothetical protein